VTDSQALGLLLVLFAFAGAKRRTLSLVSLRELAARHGFPDPDLAAAVAMAESGGYASAVGDFGTSFGLWQIHTPAHPQFRFTDLFDVDNNARAALAISNKGTNWKPWSTFNDGKHLKYLRRPAS